MNKPIAVAIVHAPGLVDLNPGAGLADLPVGTHDLFTASIDAVNSSAWAILKQAFMSTGAAYLVNSTEESKAGWFAAEEALDQFLASAATSAGRIAEQAAKIAALEALVAKRDKFAFIMGQTLHNVMVGNQAAWIEWQHGSGAEEAMTWIHNGLVGPGLIPAGREAQQWFDENVDDRYEIPEVKSSAALAGSATPSTPPAAAGWVHAPDLEWSRDGRQAAIRQERSEWHDTPVYFSQEAAKGEQYIIFGGKRMGKTYLANLEQDAARYRWLLDNYAFGDGYNAIDDALNNGEADKYLSPAIDTHRTAAIESKGGE